MPEADMTGAALPMNRFRENRRPIVISNLVTVPVAHFGNRFADRHPTAAGPHDHPPQPIPASPTASASVGPAGSPARP
jgi:hypothetical protein